MPALRAAIAAPRGRRAGWREAEFAALDFETTGLDLHRDTVVSFGVVPVREGRVVVGDAVSHLVRPAVPPSPRSQTIHHLRPQDLDHAPPLEEVRHELAGALAGRFVLAWFADVEMAFLTGIFGGRRRWRRRLIDVQRLAVALEAAEGRAGRRPDYALSAAAARYDVPVASPHDALDDALVTAQLFIVLAPRLERMGHRTAGRLLRLMWRTPQV